MLPRNLPAPLTAQEEYSLFTRFNAGDDSVLDTLVSHNLALVASLASKSCFAHDMEEGFSAGVEELVRLINTKEFDPSQGKFSTYAFHFLRGAVLKITRVKDAVYFPSGYLPKWEDDEFAVGNWDLRRHVTVEAAEELGLIDPAIEQPGFDVTEIDYVAVRAAFDELPPQERHVIREYYLDSDDKGFIARVAKQIGLSRCQTHRYRVRGLSRLRAHIEKKKYANAEGVRQVGANRWEALVWDGTGTRKSQGWRAVRDTQQEAIDAREAYLRGENVH